VQDSPSSRVPVVGIGASAGGLVAFEAFFSHLPADMDPAMAFVLVQHLAPEHPSILAELIQRFTPLQVRDAENGMVVERNGVYVIPPNTDLALVQGRLYVTPPAESRRPRLPIDHFFRSLAQEMQEEAIAIVLSGAGSDGALGVREVKEAGGLVIAQTPESAEYASMPQSAIATGLVDYILPPAEMPAQLLAYARHLTHRLLPTILPPSPQVDDALQKIFGVLRARTRHNFSEYKSSTMLRRTARRMAVHQVADLEAYLRYLQDNPDEATILFRELLIGVTRFFRDPEAFDALKTHVLPHLFDGKDADATVRVWVPGCSTGEEAYSLAILIRDYLDTHQQACTVQIFATDIDPVSIAQARTGAYPTNIAADVPPPYLERYFTREEQHYRVKKTIRDTVTFAEQDVIQDPPFSRVDLLSCRNLLIYLTADLQKKLLPLFHYALNPQGFLLLGSSESIGEFTDLFAIVNRKWKIYQRKAAVTTARTLPQVPLARVTPVPSTQERAVQPAEPRSLRQLVETILLEHYTASAVLINEKGDILFVHGSTSRYLETATGEANLNIHRMARPGLRLELTVAIRKALAQHEVIRYDGMQVPVNGGMHTVNLLVHPVSLSPAPTLLLVVFDEVPTASLPSMDTTPHAPLSDKDRRIAELERELLLKDEFLQSHVEELSTSNEELQSANEELQSTNEELDTSREELQSVNEELSTVNAELEKKVEELSQANDDMNNLLAGTDIGTIFLDDAFGIQQFTPAATRIVNIRSADIGRPLAHYSTNLTGDVRLLDAARDVYHTLTVKETEVQTTDGHWYLMRILPYRTLRNEVAGVVFTFVDVTEQHTLREALQASRLAELAHAYAEQIVETIREPLLVLDADLRVISVNQAFTTTFVVNRDDTVGRRLYDLGNGQWDIPELRRLLEAVLPERFVVTDYTVTHTFEQIGRRVMRLNARELRQETYQPRMILLAIDEVTESETP
jgi:two-component system CheB/CheR fusion protein